MSVDFARCSRCFRIKFYSLAVSYVKFNLLILYTCDITQGTVAGNFSRCSISFTDHAKFCCVDELVRLWTCRFDRFYFYFCNICICLIKGYCFFHKVLICPGNTLVYITPCIALTNRTCQRPLCTIGCYINVTLLDRTIVYFSAACFISISWNISNRSYRRRFCQCNDIIVIACQFCSVCCCFWCTVIFPVRVPVSIQISIQGFCNWTISIWLTCQFLTVCRSGQSGQFCILYCICRHGEFVCQCHGLAIATDGCSHSHIFFADLDGGRFAFFCEFIAFICCQGSCQGIVFSGFECCYCCISRICPFSRNFVSFCSGRSYICRTRSFYRCNSRKYRYFDDFVFRYWRCFCIFLTNYAKFCCGDVFVCFVFLAS